MNESVWLLTTECDRDVTLQTDLEYFRDHFGGVSMKDNWSPPPIEILGKRKRLRDFVSWMLKAPVVSQRAKVVLEPLLAGHAEILPLIRLRGVDYWAINVRRLVSCLDFEKSTVLRSPSDPGKILSVSRAAFVPERVPEVPIFKIPEWTSVTFVRRQFVDAVIDNGLRGAAFADPGVDPLGPIMRGQSLNVVPGVPQ